MSLAGRFSHICLYRISFSEKLKFFNIQRKIKFSAFGRRNSTTFTPKFIRSMNNSIEKDDSASKSSESTPEQRWKGATMEEIYRYLNPFELEHVLPVKPNENHTVLYKCPIKVPENQPPIPFRAQPKWDSIHVRLPCSEKSQYPVAFNDGTSSIEPRWEMIEKALLKPISNSNELQEAILSYNTRYADQWNFRALHKLFKDDMDESESRVFFEDLLPRIIRLALRLPDLIQAPIPLLKQGQNQSISLSQEQISCLLANAFLCTFPRRNTLKRKSEYSSFPDINFNRLFQSSGQSVLEKIKCICHYFRRVCPTERDSMNVPTGIVTFTRRSMDANELPTWDECRAPLGETLLHITSEGTIEDQGIGLLQVDFANKYLGGGVLGGGCVQEEIRFVICPELLISKLFTECLKPTEAFLMVGTERFSNYTGYASTFEWAGNHEDNVPKDSSRRRLTHIIAIDALAFVQSSHQFQEQLMLRELNKAYVGFFHPLDSPAPGVASGNWGCGAFGGDAKLKALLQLIVCSAANRPLVYYTFGNVELRDEVFKMQKFLKENNVNVQELWSVLKMFSNQKSSDLYSFIQAEVRKRRTRTTIQKQTILTKNKPMNGKEKGNYLEIKSTKFAISSMQYNQNKRKNNLSQDIFISSSESDSESVSPQAKLTSSRITIFSDNDVDDDFLLKNDFSPMKCIQNDTKSENQAETSNKVKQRSLLDMLDQSYKDANKQPLSKRFCVDKTTCN